MAGQTARKAVPATAIEGFREGSRWIHVKPGGDEVARWFTENVKLHDGLEHKDYITGIVLIPQKEKQKETAPNGNLVDVERLTFTPYPTTGARIAYLRDWIAVQSAERDLFWEIGPDPDLKRSDRLPGGFFAYAPQWVAESGKEMSQPFVGCSMQLRVYERTVRTGEKGKLIMASPAGSKVVAALKWGKPDENALMKAQTGAIGRTLAFAGMLVIPGTGVATAEDVQETLVAGLPLSGVSPEQATLPEAAGGAEGVAEGAQAAAADATDLRQQAAELIGSLQAYPEKLGEVHEWAKGRDIDLANIRDDALRGAVRLLERKLTDAQKPKPLDTGQEQQN